MPASATRFFLEKTFELQIAVLDETGDVCPATRKKAKICKCNNNDIHEQVVPSLVGASVAATARCTDGVQVSFFVSVWQDVFRCCVLFFFFFFSCCVHPRAQTDPSGALSFPIVDGVARITNVVFTSACAAMVVTVVCASDAASDVFRDCQDKAVSSLPFEVVAADMQPSAVPPPLILSLSLTAGSHPTVVGFLANMTAAAFDQSVGAALTAQTQLVNRTQLDLACALPPATLARASAQGLRNLNLTAPDEGICRDFAAGAAAAAAAAAARRGAAALQGETWTLLVEFAVVLNPLPQGAGSLGYAPQVVGALGTAIDDPASALRTSGNAGWMFEKAATGSISAQEAATPAPSGATAEPVAPPQSPAPGGGTVTEAPLTPEASWNETDEPVVLETAEPVSAGPAAPRPPPCICVVLFSLLFLAFVAAA